MAAEIGKSCYVQDEASAMPALTADIGSTRDRWHPGLRFLIIVGSAATLWILPLSAVA